MRQRYRLLYLMHVDWAWIKLRPHFVAEELSAAGFDVLVCYMPGARRRMLSANPSPIRRIPLPTLPRRDFRPIRATNRAVAGTLLSVVRRAWRPDAVFVTHPDVFGLLPRSLVQLPTFYDCMDLAVGFARNERHRRYLEAADSDLLAKADRVFVPSESLRRAIIDHGASEDRVVLVRNGHPDVSAGPTASGSTSPKATTDLGYVGMIAEWFDFEPIMAALEANPSLRVHLWGPSTTTIPRHVRLLWHGVVPRHRLDEVVAFVDAFVLPFRLSALTTVVDPIKLYEYIAWSRPTIAIYYPELDQFAPFVHFYETVDDFLMLVDALIHTDLAPPNSETVGEFLRSSTWKARARIIAQEMRVAIARGSSPAGG
jgi:teichuronic acid biosynthesis glycosyltransferase TuaH